MAATGVHPQGKPQRQPAHTHKIAAAVCYDKICLQTYRPVCGTDGRTYSNACELRLAACKDSSIEKAHDGKCTECGDQVCDETYEPVCGTDGRTYKNACALRAAICVNPDLDFQSPGICGNDYENPCNLVDCPEDYPKCVLEKVECVAPPFPCPPMARCVKANE
ncbi:unnamed protein product [Cyprideis torosa]|uniref:Uncharacterized protein n=1 Tax=Cyprideis torosa TaxID=163714 RepID=A0A7R8WTV6_9CRUS|nr:unnamed protein product [Cyprideis torosa]CAG0906028.1 unnamed protein product [Cyprideis torosa]